MDTRLAIGLAIEPAAEEVRAALVQVTGTGLNLKVASLSWATVSLRNPSGVQRAPARAGDDPGCGANAAQCPALGQHLLDAVRAVTQQASLSLEQVLVLGAIGSDPSCTESDATIISAQLAESSRVTTVAGLSSRDRAAGGRGKPLGTLVDWILGHDARHSRAVVHLDGSCTLCYLPAASGPAAVRALEVGPGVELLDALAATLSGGEQRSDARGMLAVQGRQLKPLVRRWAAHPFLRRSFAKFLGPDDFAGPFIEETVQLTLERGWSLADVLCTATHFVAACPADAIRRFLNSDRHLDEAMFVGPGTQNGFLLRLIEEQFSGIGLKTVPLVGLAPEAYDAVSAAILACLTLDGIESNLPAVTGAQGPRLLGHLTPGSAENWRRCVAWMHQAMQRTQSRAA